MIHNRYLSALFKALLCLCGLAGLILQLGFFTGNSDFSALRYYTLLSNVLVTFYFGPAAFYALKGKKPLPRFKGALIMGITVTGMVYHFMLSSTMFSMGGAQAAANILLHYVTPIMSVLDWLLFDRKGDYTKLSPVLWIWLPDLYFVLATVYGFVFGTAHPFYGGARFPYFFMDYDTLGVTGVILYVLVLNVAFVALGYVFYFADYFIAKAIARKGEKQYIAQ